MADAAQFYAFGDGDLWPSCWGADDNIYTAHGDGTLTHSGGQSEVVTTSVGLLPAPETPPAAGLVDSLAGTG